MKQVVKKVSKKRENIVAIILGLGVIVLGVFLIWLLLYSSFEHISQFVQHMYPKANMHMGFPAKWSDEKKIMLKESIKYISLFSTLYGVLFTILGLLLLKVFAFSGWLVMKKATNKSWYMAVVPAIIVLLIVFLLWPNGVVAFPRSYIIQDTILFLCFLSALFGGWIAKHVRVV